MGHFQLLAQPWWVNLLVFIPVVAFATWRGKGIEISRRQLVFAAVFAMAFGFVEAAVVVYLRAAVGLLPGYAGTLDDVRRLMRENANYPPEITTFPLSLLTVEVAREAATMVMLVSVAMLAATRAREKWAMFLWMFAVWDISYYAGLWATIRWPASLTDLDVLFLIPVPWLAQVWFPVLVSGLTMVAVGWSRGGSPAAR
ncbi:MAG TPA: hypothetical protein VF753_04350 [Terriglobales bacterium]